MIYIDTSAVLKLVHPEAESGALRTWLARHSDDLVSSARDALKPVVHCSATIPGRCRNCRPFWQ